MQIGEKYLKKKCKIKNNELIKIMRSDTLHNNISPTIIREHI